MSDAGSRYVSRGGDKLAAAIDRFSIDVRGLIACDLGSHAGGFVDCLLQHGAARVHAVDPGYGVLDYRLRKNSRVVVHERTNALRFFCPEQCDIVTIDVGWTAQRLILPAAQRALKTDGKVVSLIKPHYEAGPSQLDGGVLPRERLPGVLAQCRKDIIQLGWTILAETESPITGHGGNIECLWLLKRREANAA